MPEDFKKKFFFDTYALIEILKSNPDYVPYLEEPITITMLNLIELYYSALKYLGIERAKEYYTKYKVSVVEINDEIVFDAMKLKLKYSQKNLSYVDCIGYIYAKANKLKFLTGDKEFIGMENVEFVK